MDLSYLNDYCLEFAKKQYTSQDPSHALDHILRVLQNAKYIAQYEWWDLEIIIPAVYFHDYINPPKNTEAAKTATEDSALVAEKILLWCTNYPLEKIKWVKYAIMVCSFAKNLPKETLEAKILQDADLLESTGVISLMRTSASCGVMSRVLFDPQDPLHDYREINPTMSGFDLINYRLKLVIERFQTKTGKKLWEVRHKNLLDLEQMIKYEILQTTH